MDGLDDLEGRQATRAPPSCNLVVTWWECALFAIALALFMAFALDIILHR
jgi:hypothetical protein